MVGLDGHWKAVCTEPPPCLNTKKCAGEKHYLSDCPHMGRDKFIFLLSEYNKNKDADKKKRDANRKNANSKLWATTERRMTTEMA
jgi:hypothetical protein